jgi:hypothetical protein
MVAGNGRIANLYRNEGTGEVTAIMPPVRDVPSTIIPMHDTRPEEDRT